MQKTKIEWVRNLDGSQGYTINPIKGYCPHNCPYCYAHRMYNRFGWDRTLRFDESVFKELKTIKEPSRIFVGSMIDMYHPDMHEIWVSDIILESYKYPQHTFITLTKFPENLSVYHFPQNWWTGITVDGSIPGHIMDVCLLAFAKGGGKRFVSFEPILNVSVTRMSVKWYDWIIIGGKSPVPVHKNEWIDDIIRRADDFNIPVFIKDNAHYPTVRKEFPHEKT